MNNHPTSLLPHAFTACMVSLTALLLTACATPRGASEIRTPAATHPSAQAALRSLLFDEIEDSFQLSLPAPLMFPFDSTDLSAEARQKLLTVGRELAQLGIERTLVWGYTDNVGAAAYNVALSKRRAEIVAQVLVDGGYPASRIVAKGLGSSLPIAVNSTALGRSQNRRVVIVVQAP